MHAADAVHCHAEAGVLTITLNRPKANAINVPTSLALYAAFARLQDDPALRVGIITGTGRFFSAGWDLAGANEGEAVDADHGPGGFAGLTVFFSLSKPVIAAGRGYCFGVGFELSLACDFRLVTETTLYALPEQKLGQIPGSGGSARLQKMVGITRTKDIVMLSRRIPGRQAFDWGVATDCVPDAELEQATDALVDELRSFSPLAQRTAKKLLNDTEDSPLSIAIELEGHCYSRLRSSEDFREGVEAFHSKRKPNFVGR